MLGFGLQVRGARTVVELLTERMDSRDRTVVRRKSLMERLGFKCMACCGSRRRLRPSTVSAREDDVDEEIRSPVSGLELEVINLGLTPVMDRSIPPCIDQSPETAGMNLGAALAAERQLRAALDPDDEGSNQSPSPPRSSSNDEGGPVMVTAGNAPETPLRVSLMRLLEEADGYYCREQKKEDDGGECDSVCCVCMGRKKGAAFIPCGHTFCRVCSRELWFNRGSCPLCNRSILEILDIY